MTLSLIEYYFRVFFSLKKVALIVGVFIVVGTLARVNFGVVSDNPLRNASFAFYLPVNPNDMYRFLLFCFPFLLIMGQGLTKEWKDSTQYVTLRVRSFKKSFHCFMLSGFLGTLFSAAMGLVAVIALSRVLPTENLIDLSSMLPYLYEASPFLLSANQFVLLVLFLIHLELVQTLIYAVFANGAFALLGTLIYLLGSIWFSLSNIGLAHYFPATYGLFIFKDLMDYTFLFSYLGLILTILVLYMLTFAIYLSRREQIFSSQE